MSKSFQEIMKIIQRNFMFTSHNIGPIANDAAIGALILNGDRQPSLMAIKKIILANSIIYERPQFAVFSLN